jgi:hypothetical protein
MSLISTFYGCASFLICFIEKKKKLFFAINCLYLDSLLEEELDEEERFLLRDERERDLKKNFICKEKI